VAIPIKKIPNILSASRIFISIALLFMIDFQMIFIIAYILCGVTDILDGFLARRYKCETKFGAQLDSAGDFIFCGVLIYILITHTDFFDMKRISAEIIFVALIRIANIFITKIKFRTWGIMHTLGNKATGILLFIGVPFFLSGSNFLFAEIFIFAIAFVSASEEMIMLFKCREYEINRKSLFIK